MAINYYCLICREPYNRFGGTIHNFAHYIEYINLKIRFMNLGWTNYGFDDEQPLLFEE